MLFIVGTRHTVVLNYSLNRYTECIQQIIYIHIIIHIHIMYVCTYIYKNAPFHSLLECGVRSGSPNIMARGSGPHH